MKPRHHTLALLVAGFFRMSIQGEAQVVSGFSQQSGDTEFASPNAFPGSAGEGWRGPWEGRRYQAEENAKRQKYRKTLEGISLTSGKEGRLLQVEPIASNTDIGAAIARAYDSYGSLDIAQPYSISLTIHFNKLPKGTGRDIRDQYLFVGENSTSSIGTTNSTTWFLVAFYGRKTGASVFPENPKHRLHSALQRQWNLGTMAEGKKEFSYLSTGVEIREGASYRLTIAIDPATSTYNCQIENNGSTFTSPSLRFDPERALGKNIVIGSLHAEDDPAIFSVGDIRVSPLHR